MPENIILFSAAAGLFPDAACGLCLIAQDIIADFFLLAA